MLISVELDPALQARVDQEARRVGMTQSALVKDTLERALGLRDPAKLLRQVRSNTPMGDPDASENVSEKVRARLSAQRTD